VQQFRRLTAMSAVAVVLVGCSVQESTRSGGLIAPAGPAVTATSAAPAVVTVVGESINAPAASSRGLVETLVLPSDPDPVADAGGLLAAADPPAGFGEGVLGVTGPAGSRVWPVIVADTPQSRQRGLMGVVDFAALGGYAAMVFIFEGDTSGAFWMRDTPLPLRITFVSANGSVISGTDMVPCLAPTPSNECKRYHPAGPYRIAIEHPLGPAFDIGLAAAEFVEVTVE